MVHDRHVTALDLFSATLSRRRILTLVVVLGFAVVGTACQGATNGPSSTVRIVHDDGSGPLSAGSAPGESDVRIPKAAHPSQWWGGFGGMVLCATSNHQSITLQKVRFKTDVKPESIFASVRTVGPGHTDDEPAYALSGASFGTPPNFPQSYAIKPHPRGTWTTDLSSVHITRNCHKEMKTGPIGGFIELNEFMKVGPQGGRITHTYVDYLDNGKPYTLRIVTKYALCGNDSRFAKVCPQT